MRSSIRTFLLINLLLSLTLIISLAIIGNLFLAHKDIKLQLDAQLVHDTLQMRAFFSDYRYKKRNIAKIQSNLKKSITQEQKKIIALRENAPALTNEKKKAIESVQNNLKFQIWDEDGKLLLHSSNTPRVPLSNGKNGLSNLWLDSTAWRVNTLYDPNTELTFMVAERSHYRENLENKLTKDSIFIILIAYPFLGLLVWIIVGRGLDTLKRVAKEVRHRAPTYLEPVDLESVPIEIEPLVSELNLLFSRLQEAFLREKRFTADAAHELRTPLAALNTYTQNALRAETPEERREMLLKVLSGVNRGTHVIQQLLTLTRMTPEALQGKFIEFDLSKEAAQVAADIAPDAIAKQIDLELITTDKPQIMFGQPAAVGILLRNLIDIVIRYSPLYVKVLIVIN